jgi:hypothetical protein
MGLTLLAPLANLTDMAADLAHIKTLAEAADAKAVNARTMVLNRDSKLDQASTDAATAKADYTTLSALAATVETRTKTSEDDRAALHAQLNELAARRSADNLAIGARPVTALVLNGNTTITIPLSRTMPNDQYQVAFAHSAVAALSSVTFTNVVKTTTTVTVKINSVGLAIVAGTLICVAW